MDTCSLQLIQACSPFRGLQGNEEVHSGFSGTIHTGERQPEWEGWDGGESGGNVPASANSAPYILRHQMVVLCLVSVFNCCRGVSSYSRFCVPHGQGRFRYRFHFFQSTSHCSSICWHPQPQGIDGHPSLCHSGLASSSRSES